MEATTGRDQAVVREEERTRRIEWLSEELMKAEGEVVQFETDLNSLPPTYPPHGWRRFILLELLKGSNQRATHLRATLQQTA